MTSLYGNVGGTRKCISSAYANIGGSRKQIYPYSSSTIYTYTWEKYSVDSSNEVIFNSKGTSDYTIGQYNEENILCYNPFYYGTDVEYSNGYITLVDYESGYHKSSSNEYISFPSGLAYSIVDYSENEFNQMYLGPVYRISSSSSFEIWAGDYGNLDNYYTIYSVKYGTVYSCGSTYYGTVTSSNSDAYPKNGKSGSYWYIYQGRS